MIYFPYPPIPAEGGSAHAARRYTTLHFGGDQAPGVEYPEISDLHTPWWKTPLNAEDAAGFVIGARSRLKIPAHDIAHGPYGPDSKDFVRDGWPTGSAAEGDPWPF